MPGIILTFPIVAGKVEAWRRFCQELSGSRRQMYEASRQRLGITCERMALVAAHQYFVGNAQALKQMEMIETALRDNTKVVITEHGISPTLLLGNLPISTPSEKPNGRDRAK